MKNLAFFFLLFLGLAACNDDDMNGVICTEDFRIVSVTIEADTLPTSVYYIEGATTANVAMDKLDGSDNVYVLMTDANQDVHEGVTKSYLVEGVDADGNQLFSETYEVSADQCHIFKVSGPDVVSY